MYDQHHPTTTPSRRTGGGIAITATLLLLLLFGGGFLVGTWLLGAAMGFGDACSFTPDALQCPSGRINTATYYTYLALPPGGLLTALTVGTLGAAIAITRGRTGLRWSGIAWAIFAAAATATILISNYILW